MRFSKSVGRVLGACAFLFMLLGASKASQAQVDPNLEQGIKPYGGYYGSDFDTISMSTGALTVQIPLLSYPQTGSKLTLNFQLEFESSGWAPSVTGTGQGQVLHMTNATFNGFKIDEDQHLAVYTGCGGGYTGLLAWPGIMQSDGAVHQVGETSETLGTTWNFATADATGLTLAGFQDYYDSATSQFVITPGTITDRDGIKYTSAAPLIPTSLQTIPSLNYTKKDANGNTISYNPTTGWTDTLNRQVPISAPVPIGSDPASTSGCQGPLTTSSAYLWDVPGPSGGTTQIKVCWATVAVKTDFESTTEQDNPGANVPMVQSVVRYNGSSWTTSPAWIFAYSDRNSGDPSTMNYGSLTSVTLPTGGTISYTYATRGDGNPTGSADFTRGVISKTVNTNDGTGAHTWTYSISSAGWVETSVVTDPLGNDTVYTMTGLGNT